MTGMNAAELNVEHYLLQTIPQQQFHELLTGSPIRFDRQNISDE